MHIGASGADTGAAAGGGILGTILIILFFLWFFDGLDWVLERFEELWNAVVGRISGNKGKSLGKHNKRQLESQLEEINGLKAWRDDAQLLLVKLQVMERAGLIPLPTELAEGVDSLLQPKALTPPNKRRR